MKNLLIGVSGGIAAYKMCDVVSHFVKKGINVNVVMTEHAKEFICPLTFEALTHNPCLSSLFDGKSKDPVAHVTLGNSADVVLLAPATANTIAKIANGIADDMLSTTVLASSCKKLVAPAMFTGMLTNPATQRNIETLKKDGFEIIEPSEGRLACGAIGAGKLADVEDIISAVEEALDSTEKLAGKKVLITAGATRESLDPVRYITNHSSGKMGYALAQVAKSMGAEVTLVSGITNIRPPFGINTVITESASEMYNEVMARKDETDLFVMSAAVADYTPSSFSENKIKKSDDCLVLELKRTEDILKSICQSKSNNQKVVGFSMETENLIDNSRKKLISKNADMIVANSISEKNAGFGTDTNKAFILTKEKEIETELVSKIELAKTIFENIDL